MATTPVTVRETSVILRSLALVATPLALLVLAALVRLHNLLGMGPFVDEVGWLFWAVDRFDGRDLNALWTPLAAEGRPPLYYWVVLLLRDINPNALVGGRVAAALVSAASAGALYLLGASLWSRSVGLVAGLLWAVLPFSVFHGRIASADDSLVALFFILAMYASARMVREESRVWAALGGVLLGLAVLSKTTGVLALIAPVVAVATLGHRNHIRRLVPGLIVMAATVAVTISPLLPWASTIVEKGAQHAELGVQADFQSSAPLSALAQLLQLERLQRNAADALVIGRTYLGDAVLLAALLGAIGSIGRRNRATMFLAVVFVVSALIMLDRTVDLHSRYALVVAPPAYVLAALLAVGVGEAIAKWIEGRADAGRVRPPLGGALSVLLGLVLVAPVAATTLAILHSPHTAAITPADRWQYFDQWYALHGLSEIADRLTDEAESSRVSVVLPRSTSDIALRLPHRALRFYLRGEPEIELIEGPTIVRVRGDSAYQPYVRADHPTFIVMNEAPPDEIRKYRGESRELEQWFTSAVPSAVPVMRIARPAGPHALVLYRIDRGAGASGG